MGFRFHLRACTVRPQPTTPSAPGYCKSNSRANGAVTNLRPSDIGERCRRGRAEQIEAGASEERAPVLSPGGLTAQRLLGVSAIAQYPIARTASGPRRSHNCARYRLVGATATPGESMTPFAGSGVGDTVPDEPMAQLAAPGGCSTTIALATLFQMTAQPM